MLKDMSMGADILGLRFNWLIRDDRDRVLDYVAGKGGWIRSQYDKIYNTFYGSYKIAINGGAAPWSTQNGSIADLIVASSGLDYQHVLILCMALYNLAQNGKIKTEYWNVSQGELISAVNAAAAVEKVKNFLSPAVGAVSTSVRGVTSPLLVPLLVAGGIGLVGAVMYRKMKSK